MALPSPAADSPTSTSRLLGVVRALLNYGRQLAATLQQRNPATHLAEITRDFGTSDIGKILACIARGLLRAAALETRLASRPALQPAAPAALTAPSRCQPRAARSSARGAGAADPRLACLPTPDEIAAQVRRRPVGTVIADICRDLGIVPGNLLWHEVSLFIIANGGNLATLYKDTSKRLFAWLTDPPVATPSQRSLSLLPCTLTPATGPP